MLLQINSFSGEQPKVAPHLLASGQAQVAIDCDISGGQIRPLKALNRIVAISQTDTCKALFQYEDGTNTHWGSIDADCDFVKSPIAADPYNRLFFTGENEPRYFASDNVSDPFDPSTDYLKLGIPAPTGTISLSGYTSGGAIYRAYFYQYKNVYADRGVNGAVATVSDYASGRMSISGIATAPTGYGIDRIRVFRVNSAESSAEFQMVCEALFFSTTVAYAQGAFVVYSGALYECTAVGGHAAGAWNAGNFTAGEAVADTALGIVFDSATAYPPDEDMIGLIALPSGRLAGFVENTVVFSEPYQPWSWNPDDAQTVDRPVVSIGCIGSTVIVTTDQKVYRLYGTDPQTMGKSSYSGVNHKNFAKRSTISDMESVFFRGYEGLKRVALESAVANVTMDIISETQWNALSIIHGIIHSGRYYGFYNGGFIILDLSTGTYTRSEIGVHAACVGVDGNLYFITDDEAVMDPLSPPASTPLCIQQWNGSTTNYLYITWRSKEFILSADINVSYFRLILDKEFSDDIGSAVDLAALNASIFAGDIGGNIRDTAIGETTLRGDSMYFLSGFSVTRDMNVKIWCNGEVVSQKTVDSPDSIFTLAKGWKGKRISCEIGGYIPFRTIMMSDDLEEIIHGSSS